MNGTVRRTVIGGVLGLAAVAGALPAMSAASASPAAGEVINSPQSISGCQNTKPPDWFTGILGNAANADPGIPDSWGKSEDMARIACYESTYRTHAANGQYYGLTQMSEQSVTGVNVGWNHYQNGSSDHLVAYYQLDAALRYAKQRYGTPAAGWKHEENYGWW